jgi:hypothetical protein
MYVVTLKSQQAKEWVEENVGLEPWQWLGNSFIVDHHYIEDLEQGMVGAGFTTEDVITCPV